MKDIISFVKYCATVALLRAVDVVLRTVRNC